jgi:hypothetical protein
MRFVCLVFALSLTLSSDVVPTDRTILHVSKVNDSLYRGGRPKPADLSYLQSLKVRTVINLQGVNGVPRGTKASAHSSPATLTSTFTCELL